MSKELKKAIYGCIFLLLFLILCLSACSAVSPNPAPIPTGPSGSLATSSLPGKSTPDKFQLVDYNHSKNIFNMKYPTGWKVSEEDSFTTFTAADESISIQAAVVNTGIPLNEAGFVNFVNNTEGNNYSHLKNFLQTENKVDGKQGIARLTSQFTLGNTAQILNSIHLRKDSTIFSMHLQSAEADLPTNARLFSEMINSAQFDPTAASKLIPYNIVYDFIGRRNLFKLKIPTSWHYESRTISDGIVDIFTSPDAIVKIENLTYDDGSIIKPSQAYQLAATLLWEIYAKDMRISDAETQPDGSIRWTWSSNRNQLEGTTFYELRGTTFLMLSLYCQSDHQEIFSPLFSSIIQNYQPMQ
jgi:hypothetical protein